MASYGMNDVKNGMKIMVNHVRFFITDTVSMTSSKCKKNKRTT